MPMAGCSRRTACCESCGFLAKWTPPELIGTVLGEIADRYPENLSGDDVTMMVLRVNQRRPHYSLRERLGALLRLSVSVSVMREPPNPPRRVGFGITPREREIIAAVLSGYSDKDN